MNVKAIVLVVATVAGAAFPVGADVLLGQVSQQPTAVATDFNPERLIEKIIGNLGAAGFMAWLSYYMVARALPAKDLQLAQAQERFEAESQKQRDEHRETVNGIVGQLREQTQSVLEVVRTCAARREAQK